MEYVRWSLKYSDARTRASEATVRKMFGNPPKIPFGHDLYITAFYDLSTERPASGMGISSIPISRIREYAEYYSIENVEQFVTIISQVDRDFLTTLDEERKAQEKQAGKK